MPWTTCEYTCKLYCTCNNSNNNSSHIIPLLENIDTSLLTYYALWTSFFWKFLQIYPKNMERHQIGRGLSPFPRLFPHPTWFCKNLSGCIFIEKSLYEVLLLKEMTICLPLYLEIRLAPSPFSPKLSQVNVNDNMSYTHPWKRNYLILQFYLQERRPAPRL